jgi:hypothetical protein
VQDAGEIVLTPEDQYILGQEVEQVNRLNSWFFI